MTSFTLDRLQANLRDYDFSGIVPVSIWEKIVARFGEHKTGKKALAGKLARKLLVLRNRTIPECNRRGPVHRSGST